MFKKRNFSHGVFGNVTGESRTSGISDNNVKITSMISDIKNRNIFWNISSPITVSLTPQIKHNHTECPLHHAKTADIGGMAVAFTDNPFYKENWNTKNQVKNRQIKVQELLVS